MHLSDGHSPYAARRVAVGRHDEGRDGGEVAGHGRRAVVRAPLVEVLEPHVLRPEVSGDLADALLSVLGVVLLVVVDLERAARPFFKPTDSFTEN